MTNRALPTNSLTRERTAHAKMIPMMTVIEFFQVIKMFLIRGDISI